MPKRTDLRRFTVEEVNYYLKGCVLQDGGGKEIDTENMALKMAIHLLGDEEDGIAAVSVRRGSPYGSSEDPMKTLVKACDKAIVALDKAAFGINAALARIER
jgi:hypothetical protein